METASPKLCLSDILALDLSNRWKLGKERLSKFLNSVGLSGDEHSRSLYIFPKTTAHPTQYLDQIRTQIDENESWAFLTGRTESEKDRVVLAFPVNRGFRIAESREAVSKAQMALFIETHSRLASWWLINAWRSKQLADATWQLGDAMQFVPAAACARSLLETAASFWIETVALRNTWARVKKSHATSGSSLPDWYELTGQIYKMVWGAKFDKKVPELEKAFGLLKRSNVLTQIEKLAGASEEPVQQDYQWLCNVVHPSVGGMLAFAAPMMAHQTGTHAFQFVCIQPVSMKPLRESGYALKDDKAKVLAESPQEEEFREQTIQNALVRAATLSVRILEQTLDEALKIVDDIGLTTKAPKIASFDYWRKIVQSPGKSLCPCRSGRKRKHCHHRWIDPVPTVTERF